MTGNPADSRKGRQAMAADPKAPSSFVLPSAGGTAFANFSAADGIGAHAVETSTLLQILSLPNTESYRQVLYKCLQEWESNTTDEENQSTIASLEALKLLYAVTHLTETHVLNAKPTMADTIVFLRQHFLDSIDLGPLLEETRHPEEYEHYWKTLQSLVLRGCTQDAWHLLSHHSACQRAFDGNEDPQRQQDQLGFLALRALLESAPLPGGRTDYYDVIEADEEEDEDAHTELLDGVGRLDYQLWKTNPMAAMASWRQWRQIVTEQQSGYGGEAISYLLHREPRLQSMMQILQGDLGNRSFASWSEALCAELLYIRPNLNIKTDLAVRMQQALASQQQGTSNSNTFFEEVVISILQGVHGRVVEILFQLGGGAGAALPATMTSLMCNQLMKAKLLPESTKELQTQLLCSASDALLSSHATNPDVGMRLVALLLVPYCSSRTDLHITATLANALEHHAPQQDAAAHSLLDLLRPLVEKKKAVRILDGCVSVIVARYRYYYYDKHDYKKAMDWLVTGNDLEALLLSASCGTCLGLMEQVSLEMSFGLLKLLIGANYDTGSNTMDAQDMLTALRGQEHVDAVRLLQLVTTMAVTILEQKADRNTVVARSIAQCLASGATSKNSNNEKGHHPLAPPSMHWDLLTLANTILQQDEARYESGPAANFESSFTTEDMHVLMERHLHLDMVGLESCENNSDLNLTLAKGLMRAFLTQNAQRKDSSRHSSTAPATNNLCSTRIESYTPKDQEALVQRMLDL